MGDTIRELLDDLTGRPCCISDEQNVVIEKFLDGGGLGYSQFNEILLLAGQSRISPGFFQYLVSGEHDYHSGSAFTTRDEIRAGVNRFRHLGALRYGSVVAAYDDLSDCKLDPYELGKTVRSVDPISETVFTNRHEPVLPVCMIPGDKTYYLGYIVAAELKDRLAKDPNDLEAKKSIEEQIHVLEIGKKNHEAYLASDHMDVYVATSMRERHEYQIVHKIVADVFSTRRLQHLKVRYFDPTQAFCGQRIDKGLAEALMLKRAKCTLYLAQEADTLGKDSELASTLAQGKPVIAFVPKVTEEGEAGFVDELLAMIRKAKPNESDVSLALGQLQIFAPEAAWKEADVRRWITEPDKADQAAVRKRLGTAIRTHYDKRAKTLQDTHPLGIQVNLGNGVANGVLVARDVEQCSDLIVRVLTNTLELDLESKVLDGLRYLYLKERQTNSVFRVVSGDALLTLAFWNHYK